MKKADGVDLTLHRLHFQIMHCYPGQSAPTFAFSKTRRNSVFGENSGFLIVTGMRCQQFSATIVGAANQPLYVFTPNEIKKKPNGIFLEMSKNVFQATLMPR